jgi:hypothetical protein
VRLSLECQLIGRRSWQTKTEALLASSYQSPMNYETKHIDPITAAR